MKCFRSSVSCKARRCLLVAAAAVACGGCASFARQPLVKPEPPVNVPAPPPPVPDGAIFQSVYGDRPLFEDQRPHLPGDQLTVVFNEQISASKNSQSSADRKSESSFNADPAPLGIKEIGKLDTDMKGAHDFQGGGASSANNTLTGAITVTVVQVLYNGNLRVHGEKQLHVNQGTESILFAGTVDPRLIGPDNSIPSTRVGDARIEYVGNGYINDAQRMGWLQRAMLKVWPF